MTYTDEKVDLVINKLTRAQYDTLAQNGEIDENQLYMITDDPSMNDIVKPLRNKGDLLVYSAQTGDWDLPEGFLSISEDTKTGGKFIFIASGSFGNAYSKEEYDTIEQRDCASSATFSVNGKEVIVTRLVDYVPTGDTIAKTSELSNFVKLQSETEQVISSDIQVNGTLNVSSFSENGKGLSNIINENASKVFLTDDSLDIYDQKSDAKIVKVTHEKYQWYLNNYTQQELSNYVFVLSSDVEDVFGKRIVNVAEPSVGTDAATKNYVDNHVPENIPDMQDGRIINLVDPLNSQDAATKKYVDEHSSSGSIKALNNLQVIRPESTDNLYLKVKVYSNANMTNLLTTLDSRTTTQQQYFYGFYNNGPTIKWVKQPTDGFDETFDNMPIVIKLASLALADYPEYYISYYWYSYDTAEHPSDVYSAMMPSVTEVGANSGMTSYLLSMIDSLQQQIDELKG